MKTGYDLGFLVKNDEKEPSNRKDWKIFGRILLFLHGKRTESSNNQKQRQEYGTVHQRQIYHFRLHLRSHLYDFLFYHDNHRSKFQPGQFCKADSLRVQ